VTPTCGTPGLPRNAQVSPLDNPGGPVTGTDYLALSWSAPLTGPAPEDYQYRINGDTSTTALGTTATASPRGSNDPITLFVQARCGALVGPEASSPVYSPAPPVANFTFSTGRVNQAINFTDTSSPQATSWFWIFDDGGTATVQSPSHTFTAAGSHSVVLIASNGSGASQKIQFVSVAASSSAGTGLKSRAGSTGSEPDRQEVLLTRPQRSFTAQDPGRFRLRDVAVSGRGRMWLRITSNAAEETIVYLRFLDQAGHVYLERRLSVPAGQEAVNDIGAHGLEGRYMLELVSPKILAATLTQPRPCRDIKENCDERP
jgi:hypothetical protein